MKLYFDGCSWTKGEELENREEERYSRLVCKELGAEETNLAVCGGSNDRIVRNLLIENNIEEYDLAIIQMTFPARTEYYYDGEKVKKDRWIRINPKYNYSNWLYKRKGSISRLNEKFIDYSAFWVDYYKHVMNQKYFDTKESIHYKTISNHCKVHNVPLILTTINRWTKLEFDLQLDHGILRKIDKHHYGHPTKEGHQKIAQLIRETHLDKLST